MLRCCNRLIKAAAQDISPLRLLLPTQLTSHTLYTMTEISHRRSSRSNGEDSVPSWKSRRPTTVSAPQPLPFNAVAPAIRKRKSGKGPSHAKAKSATSLTLKKGRVPRPPNAYICYRSERTQEQRTGAFSQDLLTSPNAESLINSFVAIPADAPRPGSQKYQAMISRTIGQSESLLTPYHKYLADNLCCLFSVAERKRDCSSIFLRTRRAQGSRARSGLSRIPLQAYAHRKSPASESSTSRSPSPSPSSHEQIEGQGRVPYSFNSSRLSCKGTRHALGEERENDRVSFHARPLAPRSAAIHRKRRLRRRR